MFRKSDKAAKASSASVEAAIAGLPPHVQDKARKALQGLEGAVEGLGTIQAMSTDDPDGLVTMSLMGLITGAAMMESNKFRDRAGSTLVSGLLTATTHPDIAPPIRPILRCLCQAILTSLAVSDDPEGDDLEHTPEAEAAKLASSFRPIESSEKVADAWQRAREHYRETLHEQQAAELEAEVMAELDELPTFDPEARS